MPTYNFSITPSNDEEAGLLAVTLRHNQEALAQASAAGLPAPAFIFPQDYLLLKLDVLLKSYSQAVLTEETKALTEKYFKASQPERDKAKEALAAVDAIGLGGGGKLSVEPK